MNLINTIKKGLKKMTMVVMASIVMLISMIMPVKTDAAGLLSADGGYGWCSFIFYITVCGLFGI